MSVSAEASAAAQKPVLRMKIAHQQPSPGAVQPAAGTCNLLEPRQVAQMLRISVKVLEKWRSLKRGPAVMRLTSKTLRYHVADVEAYIASNRGET